jgi:hypothetical protein
MDIKTKHSIHAPLEGAIRLPVVRDRSEVNDLNDES